MDTIPSTIHRDRGLCILSAQPEPTFWVNKAIFSLKMLKLFPELMRELVHKIYSLIFELNFSIEPVPSPLLNGALFKFRSGTNDKFKIGAVNGKFCNFRSGI